MGPGSLDATSISQSTSRAQYETKRSQSPPSKATGLAVALLNLLISRVPAASFCASTLRNAATCLSPPWTPQ